jgi:hypothetical protein
VWSLHRCEPGSAPSSEPSARAIRRLRSIAGTTSFLLGAPHSAGARCQSPASWSQVPTVSPPSWSHPIARVMEPPRGWA